MLFGVKLVCSIRENMRRYDFRMKDTTWIRRILNILLKERPWDFQWHARSNPRQKVLSLDNCSLSEDEL